MKRSFLFSALLVAMAVLLAANSGFAMQPKNGKQTRKAVQPAGSNTTLSFEQQLARIGAAVQYRRQHGALPNAQPVRQTALSKSAQQRLLNSARATGSETNIVWAEKGTSPIFVQGKNLLPELASSATYDEVINAFNKKQKSVFGLNNVDDRLEIVKVVHDDLGKTHIRAQQVYANIPVYGRDMYLHLDADKKLTLANGRLAPIKTAIDTRPSLLAKQAEEIALAAIGAAGKHAAESSSMTIYEDKLGEFHLAYIVNVMPALDKNYEIFVDAHSGAVLHQANRVCFDGPVSASGTDLSGTRRNFGAYQIGSNNFMIDTTKPMYNAGASTFPDDGQGVIYVYDAQNGDGSQLYYNVTTNPNSWQNANAVSAMFWGNIVYDYYRNTHNRNSIDGNGGTMHIVVNFQQDYNNAFWNGKFMVFGNGDNQTFSDLAGALDVTGHEMTHGVVENTANLVYENQSGALNESFADVFGAATEFYHEGGAGDWLMGEDITTPGTSGDGLRDMEQPGGNKALRAQPAHMNEYENLPNTDDGDHGGVHVNSGIPNRAFVLVSQAIGLQKAEKIYYRALANYLTRSSQFVDARLALLQAATDLYGQGSAEQTAVGNAYSAVGITGGNGTPPPPVEDPVVGDEWILATDSQSGLLYRVSPDATIIQQIASSPLLNKPSVSDNGEFVLFVDQNYNPWLANTDGSGETQLDDSGVFWNLALSPNGIKIAAVSAYIDGSIHILDMTDSNLDVTYELYSQTYTPGEQPGFVAYADALDWTLDNQYVVYDALNVNVSAGGDTLEYWDINVIRIDDGNIVRIFPPQAVGVNIGNPVLASNNDYIMALDYVDEEGNVTIYGANLETGDVSVIAENDQSIGRPDFAPNDGAVMYQYNSSGTDYVYWRSLDTDGITGVGDETAFLVDAIFPVWLTVGVRSDVEENPPTVLPQSLNLAQNYPNPFNPTTKIQFDLPAKGHVELAVFNLLGQRLATVVDAVFEAGSHSVIFDGAELPNGVYVYRLTANGESQMRKMVLMK